MVEVVLIVLLSVGLTAVYYLVYRPLLALLDAQITHCMNLFLCLDDDALLTLKQLKVMLSHHIN